MKLDMHDAYHMVFWNECHDHIFEIEKSLLELESGQSSDTIIHHIFRMAHSIKGSAATVGIEDMVTLSHAMETVFSALRTQTITLSTHLMSNLFLAVDFLKMQHAALMSEYFEWPAIDDLVAQLGDAPMASGLSHGVNLQGPCVVRIKFVNDAELLSVKAYMIVQSLRKQVGEISAVSPAEYEDLEDEAFCGYLDIAMSAQYDQQLIFDTLSDISDIEYAVHTTTTEETSGTRMPLPDVQTIKMSAGQMDELVNHIRNLYHEMETLIAIKREFSVKSKTFNQLEDVISNVETIADSMQSTVMSTRTLPLSVLFDKYPRLVRDLSVEFGKNVKLVITGEKHGIEKSVIEAISDPLTHLVRNALDHGFEVESTRLKNGKVAQGTLKLSARQTHSEVIITVEDDGRGIDPDIIRRKALSKGFVTFDEMEYMTQRDWIDLLFEPGFTTTDIATTVSGRGVGLDVVKSSLVKLNGHIDVTTHIGEGTRFEIKLPLTLAVTKAIILKSSGCLYAIPFTSVLELVRIKGSQQEKWLNTTAYSQTFYWNDQNLPFVFIDTLFQKSTPIPRPFFVVVLSVGEKKIALGTESILGEHNISIDSVSHLIGEDKVFGNIPYLNGATTLRLGSLAYCLDTFAIAQSIT